MPTSTIRRLNHRGVHAGKPAEPVPCLLELDESPDKPLTAERPVEPMTENDTFIGPLIDLLLKGRPRLDQGLRNPGLHGLLLPRFLFVALTSFLLYGVAMVFVFDSAGVWPRLTALEDVFRSAETGNTLAFLEFATNTSGASPWFTASAWHFALAYAVGLIAATGICLPSLYFYGLLAGVKMSMRDVVIHSLRAKATAAIALIGILPMYAAVVMGVVILAGPADEGGLYPILSAALWLGLILPFIGGLFGTWTLHNGFVGLCDTMSPERRENRACFLRRLTLSWSAVYTAVSPVMIFTLWEYLERF